MEKKFDGRGIENILKNTVKIANADLGILWHKDKNSLVIAEYAKNDRIKYDNLIFEKSIDSDLIDIMEISLIVRNTNSEKLIQIFEEKFKIAIENTVFSPIVEADNLLGYLQLVNIRDKELGRITRDMIENVSIILSSILRLHSDSLVQKQTIVQLKNVSKIYGQNKAKFYALNKVNLEVKWGDFLTIVGPGGSGKSTLLNLIAGYDLPAEGNIVVYKNNIEKSNEAFRTLIRKRYIGLIFQKYCLLPELNSIENVMMPLLLQNRNFGEARDIALECLDRVGIKDKYKSRIDELSRGQQQRVAIARAIVHKPKIILADEPAGNLDTKSGNDIYNLLCDLNKANNQTILLVTHSSQAAKISGKVLRLVDGEIKSL